MKKHKIMQLIQTTATLMGCALLLIGNGPLIPSPDDEDNTPGIEIENPLPEDEGDEQYTPQSDKYPFDDNTDD